jgi:hypothetical protein
VAEVLSCCIAAGKTDAKTLKAAVVAVAAAAYFVFEGHDDPWHGLCHGRKVSAKDRGGSGNGGGGSGGGDKLLLLLMLIGASCCHGT